MAKKLPKNQLLSRISLLPIRDDVIFPGNTTPIILGRHNSLNTATHAINHKNGKVFLSLQKSSEKEFPEAKDLFEVGVIATIRTMGILPGGLNKVLVESLSIAKVKSWYKNEDMLEVDIQEIVLKLPPKRTTEILAFEVLDLFKDYAQSDPSIPNELIDTLRSLNGSAFLYYGMLPFLKTPVSFKQNILECKTLVELAASIRTLLQTQAEINALGRKIDHEVRSKIQKSQKEFFLREQLRLIHEELEETDLRFSPEIASLEKKLNAKNLPDPVHKKVLSELNRLPLLNQSSPEYSVVRNYIDWFIALPFSVYTQDRSSLASVKKSLDKNHYGLKKVKERILEHVAVLQLSKEGKPPILCLVGPPGTGKTSMGQSIASALNRKFIRISLGGIRDEAEIRGHRKTYIGAMPGKIIQALKRCESMNPVILLDEVDKLSSDWRGDPSSALLELLDPEQNHDFTDNYLEIGIDLSQVLFLCTANVAEKIPEALADRMETIRLSGYDSSEKRMIAQKHLIPKVARRNGLTLQNDLLFSSEILDQIIGEYTREAGVRGLERELSKIARKRATEKVSHKKFSPSILSTHLVRYLGIPRFEHKTVVDLMRPGIVTGLAWTPVGGAILQIECVLLSGKGRLKLTGTLGDVMKESAHIALTLVRERASRYGINPKIFQATDIHIHFPEGAIPKDGPSAGIGLTVVLLSAFTRQKVPADFAFTGEVSLTGQLHAIGGLAEKSLAALEAGVKQVIVPKENEKNVSELPLRVRKGIKFFKLEHIDAVLKKIFKTAKNSKH